MKEKAPFMPFFGRDCYSDPNVMLLELDQEACYIRLSWFCWQEGSLPNDPRKLAALCKNPPKFAQNIWPALRELFVVDTNGRLIHPKVEAIRTGKEAFRQKRSKAGQIGNQKRWMRSEQYTNATDLPPSSDIEASDSGSQSDRKVIAKPSLSYSYASSSSNVIEETARAIDSVVEKGPVLDTSIDHFNEPEQEDDKHSDWDSFQAAYPQPKRNTRIEPACRAYVGRIDGKLGEHGRLMAGLQRHLVSDQWVRSLRDDGGRFIPSMEKFIVDGLYSDHPPAYRPETSAKNEYSLAIAKMYSEVQREKEEENS